MNILNKISLTIGAVCFAGLVFGQDPMVNDQAQSSNTATNDDAVNSSWKPTLIKDGIIDMVPHTNKALELNPIREIDIAWKSRVWREIDVRQKQNQAFRYVGDEYTGGGAFIEILNDAVKKGKIAAYSGIDDRFTTPLDMEAFQNAIGGRLDTIPVTDPVTGETIMQYKRTEFDINSVTRYRIKEDWIFNRNTGRMEVRILGIAPLIDIKSESTGDYIGSAPMYWLYYPDLRNILVNYEVYNPRNDMKRMTWTDYFDGHYFASYVVKTSSNNPTLTPLPNGLRGLQEGQELVNKIIEREMDMWQE